MNGVEKLKLAERILSFYKNGGNKSLKATCNHFKIEGIPRATVYNYIKRFRDSEGVHFKKKPGRVPTIATPKKLKYLKKFQIQSFDFNPNRCRQIKDEEILTS